MSVSTTIQPRLGTRGRLHSLDGLRGVAAFSVLLHHAIIVAYPHLRDVYKGNEPIEPAGSLLWWFTHTPLHVPWLGAEAVYTFFILSGLVLTRPVLAATKFKWKAYYPKRMVRLYLPVWGSLVVAVAITLAVALTNVAHAQGWADARIDLFTPWKLFREGVLILGAGSTNGVLWSLMWEVLFSLLLPLYVLFAATRTANWYSKLAVVFLTAVIGRTVLFEQTLLGEAFFYMSMFALGSIMAAEFGRLEDLAERIGASSKAGLMWSLLVAAAAILLSAYWLVLAFSPPLWLLEASPVLSLAGAGLLVFIAAFNPRARTILETPIVQWMGLVSFSLYLTHAILLEAIDALLPAGREPLVMMIGMPASLVLAVIFHRFIELPSMHLAKRVQVGSR